MEVIKDEVVGVEHKRADQNEIKEKYQPGKGVHPCPECGKECNIEHEVTEFEDFIYCDKCRMKFTRNREPLVEHTYKDNSTSIVIENKREKEDYVDYRCYECNSEHVEYDYRIHERTVPDGEFEPVETGVSGYDICDLKCPCGEKHNGYLDIGEKVQCECGREYELAKYE